jgi:preprotein translocase subunit SecA
MTGTAKTEEEEFRKIYNMRVVTIPTNRPIKREDAIDYVYATKAAKLKALVKEVGERHAKGQPILIGTTSVESSEEVSRLLDEAGLRHEVLNAKNHAREAEIISHAGEKGQITLATNMAGRGTDIKLTDEIKALGGLCVFGTERHESRRIDNQLRGRSGRQGDPGFSRFYVSLDDELMLRFGSEGLKKAFANLGDEAIESGLISKAITSAQKRVEGRNFDTRKNLLDYDDVLSKQRKIIYSKRDAILFAENIHDLVEEMFKTAGIALAKKSVDANSTDGLITAAQLSRILIPRFLPEGSVDFEAYEGLTPEEAAGDITELLKQMYVHHSKEWTEDIKDKVERQISLKCIDRNWTTHIDEMTHLRDSIYLRSYAQSNPLQEYVNEGYKMFSDMLELVAIEVILNLENCRVRMTPPTEQQENPENQQPEEPKIESKNKEDKSLLDTTKKPTLTTKEN